MIYRLLANLTVVVHALFVLFVVLGWIPVLRWPRVAWVHLPVAVWGALIEFTALRCPLTPLEKWLRVRGGLEAYDGGFIRHYMAPWLDSMGLTREVQSTLGIVLVAIQLTVYGRLLLRRRAGHGGSTT